MERKEIVNQLFSICDGTAQFIRDHFGRLDQDQIITKSKNSLVSFVDQEAEKMIVKGLRNILPEAAFLTEEEMVKNTESNYQWIVDPLDGTTNFVVGIPHFAISIALKKENKVILGVVFDIMQKDFYTAIEGKGAHLNGQALRVSHPENLDSCAIATGFPYDKSLIGTAHQNTLMYFLTNARILRRLGSAALDLCFVAKGTFDLYYEKHLNAWDIAAGALIVNEAGGIVSDISGGQDFLSNGDIIAHGKGLENEANKIIKFFHG